MSRKIDQSLVAEVAAELEATSTYVDIREDTIDGSLEDAVDAVLTVLYRRGLLADPAPQGDQR